MMYHIILNSVHFTEKKRNKDLNREDFYGKKQMDTLPCLREQNEVADTGRCGNDKRVSDLADIVLKINKCHAK